MTSTDSVLTYAVVLRFLLIFFVAYAAFVAIVLGLEAVGVSLGSAANNLVVIPPAIGAIMCGDYFFGKAGRLPRMGESWRYAAIFAVILFLFMLAALALLWPIQGIPQDYFSTLVVLMAVLCLILLPIFRAAFGFGARASEKRATALEEKAAKDKL